MENKEMKRNTRQENMITDNLDKLAPLSVGGDMHKSSFFGLNGIQHERRRKNFYYWSNHEDLIPGLIITKNAKLRMSGATRENLDKLAPLSIGGDMHKSSFFTQTVGSKDRGFQVKIFHIHLFVHVLETGMKQFW